MAVDVSLVGDRLVELRRRMAQAGGDGVTVVAVTKGFGPEVVEAAVAVGLDDIGENYAQELLAKLAGLGEVRPRVHFIGRLQSNKVRSLAGVVDLWQSIDRASLVEPLAKLTPPANVLVQVNVSDEPGKGGCAPGDVAALVARLREREVVVEGLMAVGRTGPPESARPGFRLLRALVDDLGLTTCSMGMTDDLEVAVQEGSTMVRVGSALFGPRPSTRARAN
jgi:pyridoxal phosphate enzyme (YggS family)